MIEIGIKGLSIDVWPWDDCEFSVQERGKKTFHQLAIVYGSTNVQFYLTDDKVIDLAAKLGTLARAVEEQRDGTAARIDALMAKPPQTDLTIT